jgi:N-methylhydantoinase B/oxoprolinase/acetone carboxylase alpha subunit
MTDKTGNLPPLPSIFPDYQAPIARNQQEERDLTMARWVIPLKDCREIAAQPIGACGTPTTKDPAQVLRDVEDELVSGDAARNSYGVRINEDTMTLDLQATEALRGRLTSEGGDWLAV